MPRIKILPAVDPIGQVKPIDGKMPDSVEEYRFAVGLYKRDLKFDFQFPVSGGRSVRGGTIIDFLVQTAPLPTPVFIDGEYWHARSQQQQDEFLRAQIVSIFKGAVRDPVSIAAGLLKTQEATDTIIRKLFG